MKQTERRPVAPPGLERKVWQRLPAILFWGSALPVSCAVFARLTAPEVRDHAHDKALLLLDYTMAGAVLLNWTLVVTVAIACWIVMVMKGPVQMADPCALQDSDRPSPAGRPGPPAA
jgi:hypothetical protein